ncbi:MAG: hypothetical protein M1837_003025 [Sclerophora amabilis]|nr:MAG: hypothetical protein M1837_003025 [Sclerophora amabilis]
MSKLDFGHLADTALELDATSFSSVLNVAGAGWQKSTAYVYKTRGVTRALAFFSVACMVFLWIRMDSVDWAEQMLPDDGNVRHFHSWEPFLRTSKNAAEAAVPGYTAKPENFTGRRYDEQNRGPTFDKWFESSKASRSLYDEEQSRSIKTGRVKTTIHIMASANKNFNRQQGTLLGCNDITETLGQDDDWLEGATVENVLFSTRFGNVPNQRSATTADLLREMKVSKQLALIAIFLITAAAAVQYRSRRSNSRTARQLTGLHSNGSTAIPPQKRRLFSNSIAQDFAYPPNEQQKTVEPRSEPRSRPSPTEPEKTVTKTQVIPYDTSLNKERKYADEEVRAMTDEQVTELGTRGVLALYSLEKVLQDPARAVRVRRMIVSGHEATKETSHLVKTSALPHENYDYGRVLGACCENVIGYLPLPVGVAGPLNIDGTHLFLPMATTEGVLVASTNRGCTAINAGGGVVTALLDDGMTRGPSVRFPNLQRASTAKAWLDSEKGFLAIESAFNSTSRFARLQSIKTVVVGSDLFVRFKSTTGDAMGMNMMSKGVEESLTAIANNGFEDMYVLSLSGNYCTDKKPSAVNWIEGRGKTLSAQATISADVIQRVLKTDVDTLVELNTSKNLVGSALAGSMGGFNAHASNIVSAIFLATGQDPAQNVESSNCLTVMKKLDDNLQISVYMPSIEVGTVGGGTLLEPQRAMLDLLGVRGSNDEFPGRNAQKLARVVAAGVLAGELSLCSALAAGSLVRSHMAHNRKQ